MSRPLFDKVNTSEPYTDWEAGCNYRSPASAVRVNLMHDAESGKWAVTLLQEDGAHEGAFEIVIDREIPADQAQAFLATVYAEREDA